MQVEQAEIDGVTVLWADTGPGATVGALSFGVGRADETAATGGITHLVEHLALARFGQQDFEHNGFVDGTRSVLHAAGTPAEVAEHLSGGDPVALGHALGPAPARAPHPPGRGGAGGTAAWPGRSCGTGSAPLGTACPGSTSTACTWLGPEPRAPVGRGAVHAVQRRRLVQRTAAGRPPPGASGRPASGPPAGDPDRGHRVAGARGVAGPRCRAELPRAPVVRVERRGDASSSGEHARPAVRARASSTTSRSTTCPSTGRRRTSSSARTARTTGSPPCARRCSRSCSGSRPMDRPTRSLPPSGPGSRGGSRTATAGSATSTSRRRSTCSGSRCASPTRWPSDGAR